jgi:hypothetical protein
MSCVVDSKPIERRNGGWRNDADNRIALRQRGTDQQGGRASVMTPKRLYVVNAVIAGGYGIALLVATDPILDVYGITPNPEGIYMTRWFGLELLAIGLTTWLARDAADSAGGHAVARALTVSYGMGVFLALWGTLFGPFNALGWVAVGLNLLLGSSFAWFQFLKPRTASAAPA